MTLIDGVVIILILLEIVIFYGLYTIGAFKDWYNEWDEWIEKTPKNQARYFWSFLIFAIMISYFIVR